MITADYTLEKQYTDLPFKFQDLLSMTHSKVTIFVQIGINVKATSKTEASGTNEQIIAQHLADGPHIYDYIHSTYIV